MKARGLAALLLLATGVIGCGSGSGHFIYVVGQGTNSVFGFNEQGTGTLSPLTSGFSTDSVPVSIVIHPSGKLAYVANFAAGTVTVFTRDPGKGTLTVAKDPVTNNQIGPIAVGTNPIALAVSSGFLYVLNQGDSKIAVFTIDSSTGNLTVLKTSPFGTPASPRSMALAANGKVLYVANPTLGTVSGFTVGSDGGLSGISGSPFSAGTAPSWVSVDPQSRFLYVADSSANNVLGFTINSGGSLTAISGSPFAAGTHPAGLGIDSNGAFLFAANQGSNNVSAYSIGSGGSLTAVSGSPFATGTGPVFVTVDSTNRFVYVGDSGSNDIAGFSLSGGSLKSISGSPFNLATSPTWITSQ